MTLHLIMFSYPLLITVNPVYSNLRFTLSAKRSQCRKDPDHILRAEATHEIFKIAKIYPAHADIASEMFLKSTDDSKKLFESYWNQVSTKGNFLFNTKADLYRHFIGNFYQRKDFYKRPLSKFQFDILVETKLVDYIKNLPERPVRSKAVPLKAV